MGINNIDVRFCEAKRARHVDAASERWDLLLGLAQRVSTRIACDRGFVCCVELS